MVWFKVDDSFHSHPKVMATDPAALGLWVIAGSWCGANLTDGFVPDHVLPRLLPGAAKLAKKLITAGLWVRTEGGYHFHDWHRFNPSAEQVKAERAAGAERQRRFRAHRDAARHAVTDGVTNSVTNGGSHAAPTRPDPSTCGPVDEKSLVNAGDCLPARSRARTKQGTRIPADFAVTAEMVSWARENTPYVDERFETAQFRDYWRAKGGRDATKLDWVATWRTWMRNAEKRAPHTNGHRSGTDENIRRLLSGTGADPSNVIALPGGGR